MSRVWTSAVTSTVLAPSVAEPSMVVVVDPVKVTSSLPIGTAPSAEIVVALTVDFTVSDDWLATVRSVTAVSDALAPTVTLVLSVSETEISAMSADTKTAPPPEVASALIVLSVVELGYRSCGRGQRRRVADRDRVGTAEGGVHLHEAAGRSQRSVQAEALGRLGDLDVGSEIDIATGRNQLRSIADIDRGGRGDVEIDEQAAEGDRCGYPAASPLMLAVMASSAFTVSDDPFTRPPAPTLALTLLLIVLAP